MHPDIREIFHELRQHKDELVRALQRTETMNSAEQTAFDLLNAKADTLVKAVGDLTTLVSTEAQQLKDALAAGDGEDIVSAATALSAKLDTGIAAAQAALAPPVVAAPAAPVAPPAAS